jgi:hypothetical protein
VSVEAFFLERDPCRIKNMAQQLVRELILVEDESRNLKLDQSATISKYFGGTEEELQVMKTIQDDWYRARTTMMTSAEKLLSASLTSSEFQIINAEWISTLRSFRHATDEINATVATKALCNLAHTFKGSIS